MAAPRARIVPEPRPSLRRILQVAREQGPGDVVRLGLYHLGIHRRVSVSPFGRFAGLPPRPERAPRLPVVPAQLGPAQIDEYLAFRPDQSRAEVEHRFALGHRCWVVRLGGRIVGGAWQGWNLVPLEYLECDLHLAPDTVYHYDDFVRPEYRRQRVLGGLRHASAPTREEMPAPPRAVSIVLPENMPAFQRFGRWRSAFAAEIHQLRLGPLRWLFVLLDRELVEGEELPVRFEHRGRSLRAFRVEGPLGRDAWRRTERPPFVRLRRGLDRGGLLRRRRIVCFANADEPRSLPRRPLEGAPLGPEDVDAYLALRRDQTREEVEARLAAGQRCFVGRLWGELVAASWAATGPVAFPELGCALRPAPDTALVYDDFVRPQHRRRRLLAGLVKARSRHLLEAGLKRTVGLVAPENTGAWEHVRTHGRPVVGELVRVSLGPWAQTRLRLDPRALAGEPAPLELVEELSAAGPGPAPSSPGGARARSRGRSATTAS